MNDKFLGFVYLIECKINNKIYVGITADSIQKRWNKHVYDARHQSICVIHRAMRKYGIDNFSIRKLKECSSAEELFISEQSLIKELRSHVSFGGYNETFGGEAPMLGRNHSPKSKKLISQKLKGRPSPNKGKVASLETRQKLSECHSKSVVQLDMDGNTVAVYKSLTEASKATGIADSNISGVCRNKKKTAGGFIWQYTRL